jgi:hypothetical protein
MSDERGKLLYSHETDNAKCVEVRVCMDDPNCKVISIEDVELGEYQQIHLKSKLSQLTMAEAFK